MSVLVYRWQDVEGRGPYRPGMTRYWADEGQQQNNPPFFVEFGMDVTKQCAPDEFMGCAFRSVDQMLRWFTEAERQRMRLLGYVFGSMLADRVIAESDRQLVFARRLPLRRGFTPVESERALA